MSPLHNAWKSLETDRTGIYIATRMVQKIAAANLPDINRFMVSTGG
jgi:hypothetical protein